MQLSIHIHTELSVVWLQREIADIAVVLKLSESTVKRRWQAARLWLYEALQPQDG